MTEQPTNELKLQLDLLHTWTIKRLRDENPELAHLIKAPLHEGQLPLVKAIFYDGKLECMLQCGRSFGKLLTLNELIPTPDRGFVPLSHISPGDKVFDENGEVCNVIGESPIDNNPILYKIHFSDGSTIDACKDHRWLTNTKLERRSQKRNKSSYSRYPVQVSQVRTTEEIKNTLMHGDEFNHSICPTQPLELPEKHLPVHPYVLGCWLGDGGQGGAVICKPDSEIFEEIKKCGYEVSDWYADKKSRGVVGLAAQLREIGVLKHKHVPNQYLWGSKNQRLALLQGLMDSDGTASKSGYVCFDNTNKNIADAVYHLMVSLGEIPLRSQRYGKLYGVKKKLCYRVYTRPVNPVFRIARKLSRLKPKTKCFQRTITKVEPIESRPGKCISVDSPSHLFLAGTQMVPTHNTEEVLYIATRWALSRPKQIIYLLCPERKQAKEIYWASRRVQDYPHKSQVAEERDSELRLVFTNGSFICIDGSDNYKSLRGVKPNLVVYDEFQDHDRRVDEAMRPNLGSKKAPLIRIGTPPEQEGYYTEIRKDIIKHVKRGSPVHFYLERPTSTNPYFDKEFLKREQERLSERGEVDQYLREYEAKFIPGGAGSVFPMFHKRKEAVVKSKPELLKMISKDRKNMNWYTILDPGQSCFAVMFACVNRYTSQMYLLDEIYELDRNKTSSGQIWPRVKAIQKSLCSYDNKWSTYCDEAASWFPLEIFDSFGENIYPTKKAKHNKKDDVSFIKDLILKDDSFYISSDMPGLIKELENYVTKEDGSYIKRNDHQIDNLRYLISLSGFRFYAETPEAPNAKPIPLSLEQILKDQSLEEDPFSDSGRELAWDDVAYEWH